ncbi:cobalamin biosynthesis protein [Chloroflexota bacterium]
MDTLLILLVALTVDLTLGEPPRLFHPVVWLGKVISFLERGGAGQPRLAQFVYGIVMSLLLIGLFAAATYFILLYLKSLSFVAYVIVGVVILKSTFSMKELWGVALRVKKFLLEEKLDEAHRELRSLVSRDTRGLPESLVVSATVESVAENTCDSFVAPLFYFLLFGVSGSVAYRVVNTLDAMVGYHGEYEYLGKFASKLDDVLNFIPARLTALLLVLASFVLGRDARVTWQVALSEHSKTESPNAGWTMAAVAGALNVQLEKVGDYKLGRADAPLVPETIDAALKLMLISMLSWSLICLIAGVIRFAVTS